MQIFVGLHCVESWNCWQQHSKHRNKIDWGAYLCALLGFAYGLSSISAILVFSATARMAYFQFTDNTLEEFRTVVEIN